MIPSTSYGQCPGPCGQNADGKITRGDLSGAGQPSTVAGSLTVYDATAPLAATASAFAATLGDGLHVFDASGHALQIDASYDPSFGLRADSQFIYYVSRPVNQEGSTEPNGIFRTNGATSTKVVSGPDDATAFEAFTIEGGQALVALTCQDSIGSDEWCSRTGIYAASLPSSTPPAVVLSLPQSEFSGNQAVIAVESDGSSVVWAIADDTSANVYGTSLSYPAAPSSPLLSLTGEAYASSLVDGPYVYVCTTNDPDNDSVHGKLRRVSLSDGSVTVLVDSGCSSIQGVGSSVYYQTFDYPQVVRKITGE